MKRLPIVSFSVILLLSACATMKVYIDFDETADFDSFETFMFKDTPDGSMSESSPLIHQRMVNSIEKHFGASGMEKVDADPDLFVTYYTSTRQEVRVNTSHYGYGYPSRWHRAPYWGGSMATSTTTVSNYDVGTLVIDAWDANSEELVWRGVAEDTVPSDPDKASARIDKAIARMVEESQARM